MKKVVVIILFLCCSVYSIGQQREFLYYTIADPLDNIHTLKERLKTASVKEKPYIEYELGESYFLLNQEDDAYKYFKIAGKHFLEQKISHYYDCLYFLHLTFTRNNFQYVDTSFINLTKFYKYAKAINDPLRMGLAQIELSKLKLKNIKTIPSATLSTLAHLDSAKYYIQKSDSLNLLFNIELIKGVTFVLDGKPNKAKEQYLLALGEATKFKNNANLFLVYNNLGKLELDYKNYSAAETYLQLAESTPLRRFQNASCHLLYNNFKNLYKQTDNSELYLKYSTKFDSISSVLNLQEQSLQIARHELSEKDKKITQLSVLKHQFQKHKYIYGGTIFLIFCLAMYSIFRWIKSDRNKKRLEIERQQTELKLNQIKQLVVKDHIILRNKAKIYIENLMYIKSEDHYLTLFTRDKKEFIRGKIKDLIKELPPNFKQSHRSYIVNTNFIESITSTHIYLMDKTEIPLSRTYKKYFD
ncbi:MAG: LytR/AlgR family response regulator transcription factor [Moheibacter sp.]